LNDLGAVGLILLLGYLALFFRDSIRLYAIDRSQGALFLGLLLQQATINLSEPLWFNVLLVDFVIMSIATTCLARSLLESRHRKPISNSIAGEHRSARSVGQRLFRPSNPRAGRT
jgi:di/tricarboxylate transporter